MFIRVGYEIVFDIPAPVPMLLMLYTLPDRVADLRAPDRLRVEPAVPVTDFTDWFGNRCARLVAPAGRLRLCSDLIVEDSGLPLPVAGDAAQHPVEDLPAECLQFLLGSRYCEVDRLSDIAWGLFGQAAPGWARVQAVCDWVHEHVEFGYQYARPTKTAYDVYEERQGVCRDFTHLALTFCRALNIPARYATGYLGDIGFPVNPNPMDFSACFQVYLGGRWHTFDARHNQRRIGWILMATGRDATDCAITTSFGPSTLQKFVVWTDEVPSPELPDPRC
ncbi:MAG: transglutaminase family protein [Armatimonadetes bacterium]|nr:transglutaminase family protein [Armatimonadota bacterium]